MLVSIVTVHLDDFAGLAETRKSLVREMGSASLQWLVIDGQSTPHSDKEKAILSETERSADIFISGPDQGIYDAMNKGLALATGDYILFLNAGDTLHPDFKFSTLEASLGASRPDMVWGKTCIQYPDKSYGVKKLRGPSWGWYGMPVCHQSVLFSREYFADLAYDTSLTIAADYDLLARELRKGATVYVHEHVISIYAAGGESQQDKARSLHEEALVRAKHYPVPQWASFLVSTFRHQLWKLSDASPSFNRFWRKWV